MIWSVRADGRSDRVTGTGRAERHTPADRSARDREESRRQAFWRDAPPGLHIRSMAAGFELIACLLPLNVAIPSPHARCRHAPCVASDCSVIGSRAGSPARNL